VLNTRKSLFLLGGREGVAHIAAEKLVAEVPNLQIAGTHHGYFLSDAKTETKLINEIVSTGAGVIVLGFGSPLQEEWFLKIVIDWETEFYNGR
jgi:UDP-N-acetyl-D-mannosaminuronic acid transferase (WecB/TagA/CpsF family)